MGTSASAVKREVKEGEILDPTLYRVSTTSEAISTYSVYGKTVTKGGKTDEDAEVSGSKDLGLSFRIPDREAFYNAFRKEKKKTNPEAFGWIFDSIPESKEEQYQIGSELLKGPVPEESNTIVKVYEEFDSVQDLDYLILETDNGIKLRFDYLVIGGLETYEQEEERINTDYRRWKHNYRERKRTGKTTSTPLKYSFGKPSPEGTNLNSKESLLRLKRFLKLYTNILDNNRLLDTKIECALEPDQINIELFMECLERRQ